MNALATANRDHTPVLPAHHQSSAQISCDLEELADTYQVALKKTNSGHTPTAAHHSSSKRSSLTSRVSWFISAASIGKSRRDSAMSEVTLPADLLAASAASFDLDEDYGGLSDLDEDQVSGDMTNSMQSSGRRISVEFGRNGRWESVPAPPPNTSKQGGSPSSKSLAKKFSLFALTKPVRQLTGGSRSNNSGSKASWRQRKQQKKQQDDEGKSEDDAVVWEPVTKNTQPVFIPPKTKNLERQSTATTATAATSLASSLRSSAMSSSLLAPPMKPQRKASMLTGGAGPEEDEIEPQPQHE